MRHVDGLLLFLDLPGAVDADREGHHVAPPGAVFSPLRCCRGDDTVCSWRLISSSRASILSRSSISAGVGQGRLSIVLALPLSGHTHPLLTDVIQELPYVPETVERVHGRDHRPPYRPLSHGKGDRSDLNKRAINHGCLQSSFQQIHSLHAEGRRQALEGPDREVVHSHLELSDA